MSLDSSKSEGMISMNNEKKIWESTIFTFLTMSTIILLECGSKGTISMENLSLPNKFLKIFTQSIKTRPLLKNIPLFSTAECSPFTPANTQKSWKDSSSNRNPKAKRSNHIKLSLSSWNLWVQWCLQFVTRWHRTLKYDLWVCDR